jgi:tetratricopeptide (TPR) repeat protein
VALLLGCQRTPADVERCLELSQTAAHAEAAAVCERAFTATQRPDVGIAAARELYQLERDDDVLRLAGLLRAGPEAATATQLIGRVTLARGQRDEGWRLLGEALTLHRRAGDHAGATRDAVLLTTSYRRAGRYREALASAEVAAREAELAGARADHQWALLAGAEVFAAIGDHRRSGELLRKGLALVADDDPRTVASIQIKLGRLAVAEGAPELAAASFHQAHAAAIAAGDGELAASAAVNQADVALAAGRLAEAAAALAAARAATAPGKPLLIAIPVNEALLALARDDLDGAERAIEAAAATTPTPVWMWRIEELRGQVAARRGNPAAAAEALRRSIALVEAQRATLDAVDLRAALLAERRRPYERLFELLVGTGDVTTAFLVMDQVQSRGFLDAFIDAAPAEVDALTRVDTVRAVSAAVDAVAPATLVGDVLAASELRDRVVVAYFEALDRVWCVLIAGGRVRAVRLAASATAIAGLVDRFLGEPDDVEVATQLGNLLLPAEIGPLPPGTLHVVPSAALSRLPFGVLRRGDGRLLDSYRLLYLPSVSALVATSRRARRRATATAAPVVLADSRGDLPGAAAEARAVAAMFGVAPGLGAAATRARLREAGAAPLLHLAVHSGVAAGGAWLSLADDEVTVPEILDGDAAPRLVVLASCASAATRRELWGSLGAAFLAAGSATVLASLWSVDDAATVALITAFYSHGGATHPAEALALAQRDLARTHPASAWAAFVLLGAGDP